ncbi:MAG: rhodanese-like domain-containing protein [Cyclobacteriaceae bacterium]|nr:rhodanese-like domain-containing protein [Cyclobacteriaceae bacterium]
MKTILILVFCAAYVIVSAQAKEYVCTPCGSACDKTVHTKPGACPTCHMKLVEKAAILFENLTTDAFCKRITENPNGVLILDVRTKSEFEGTSLRTTYGYFKNALNINVEDLEARMGELTKYKDKEVLVYCSQSIRSPRAAMMLTQNGFQTVKNMSGGVSTLRVDGNECLMRNFVVHK